MANLLPDIRKWGIRGAATVVVASLIYQARDLVSDGVLVVCAVVAALMVACWLMGIGFTEVYKRRKYPDRKTWKTDAVKNDLWVAATVISGFPLTALLLAYFSPLALFEGMLLVVLGVGAGTLQPFVYNFISDILWPMIRRSLVAMKFVVKDNTIIQVPEDTPQDEYDRTVMTGEATVPKPEEKKDADENPGR